MKVLWQNHSIEEATWEREDDIKNKYPHLFQTKGNKILEQNSFKAGEKCNTPN